MSNVDSGFLMAFCLRDPNVIMSVDPDTVAFAAALYPNINYFYAKVEALSDDEVADVVTTEPVITPTVVVTPDIPVDPDPAPPPPDVPEGPVVE